MHATESGVVDHLAINDSHALDLARSAVAALEYKPLGQASAYALPTRESEEPVHDPKELGGIVGTNLKKSWDMREVIARVVDGSRFHEWKKEYGPTVVTGFGEFCSGFLVLPEIVTLSLWILGHSPHPRLPCWNRSSSTKLVRESFS